MIGKGELRLGSMVTIQERQSMQWRHWGKLCALSRLVRGETITETSIDHAHSFNHLRDLIIIRLYI